MHKLLIIKEAILRFMESFDLQQWTGIGAMNLPGVVGRAVLCPPQLARDRFTLPLRGQGTFQNLGFELADLTNVTSVSAG